MFVYGKCLLKKYCSAYNQISESILVLMSNNSNDRATVKKASFFLIYLQYVYLCGGVLAPTMTYDFLRPKKWHVSLASNYISSSPHPLEKPRAHDPGHWGISGGEWPARWRRWAREVTHMWVAECVRLWLTAPRLSSVLDGWRCYDGGSRER